MRGISELLHHLSEDNAPSISPDGMIARLEEYASRFGASCPFQVGDIVKARKGGVHVERFSRQPAIVLEVFPFTVIAQGGEPGTPEFMRRVDMRVAQYFPHVDSVVERVVHSIEMEPYDGAE